MNYNFTIDLVLEANDTNIIVPISPDVSTMILPLKLKFLKTTRLEKRLKLRNIVYSAVLS